MVLRHRWLYIWRGKHHQRKLPTDDEKLFEKLKKIELSSLTLLKTYDKTLLRKKRLRLKQTDYMLTDEARWSSTFDESDTSAREQGQNMGACLVLWRQIHAGTIHSTRTENHYISGRTIKVDGKKVKLEDYTECTTHPVDYENYDFVGLFFGKYQILFNEWGMDLQEPSQEFMASQDSRRGIAVSSAQEDSLAYT